MGNGRQLNEDAKKQVDEDGTSPPRRKSVRRKLVQVTLFRQHIQCDGHENDKEEHSKEGNCLVSGSERDDRSARQLESGDEDNKGAGEEKPMFQAMVDDVGGSGEQEELMMMKCNAPVTGRRHLRRYVQSTLMPHRTQENENKIGRKNIVKDGQGDIDEADTKEVDCCGGQLNKMTTKRKASRSKEPSQITNHATKDTRRSYKPKKREGKATPAKNAKASDLKDKLLFKNEACESIPDLWLEAKTTAEENSRMFTGRQIHPFFSFRTVSKCSETAALPSSSYMSESDMVSVPFAPIHVFERIQDDFPTLDWRLWEFCETESAHNGFKVKTDMLISTFPDLVELNRTMHTPACVEEVAANKQGVCSMNIENVMLDKDHVVDNGGLSSDGTNSFGCSTVDDFNKLSPIRLTSCYLDNSLFEYSLWTDKYLPRQAKQVCGNGESVDFLNKWLQHWHERDFQADTNLSKCSTFSSSESDSDSEDTMLKNVLLVTGPVGSGKSAAIYACAKEQGFHILELNTSECRSGSMVRLRIGEALESHSLKRSLENSVVSCQKQSSLGEGVSEVVKLQHSIYDKNSPDATNVRMDTLHSGTTLDRTGRTLILFEDVDIAFHEDKGLVCAIQQLAETAKQPMILTSNCRNPALRDCFAMMKVSFVIPSPSQLFNHLYMVCAAEKACVQPHLLEQFIECCRGDLRKTLMHLQFWLQHRTGKIVDTRCIRLPFSLNADHLMLSNIFSWECHSHLSEFVAKEISKTVYAFEEISFTGVTKELNDNVVQNFLEVAKNEDLVMKYKKDEMLSRNGYFDDFDGAAHYEATHELSHSSGSPIAITRKKSGRRLMVMSSSSEEELCSHEAPLVVEGDVCCELWGTENGLETEALSKSQDVSCVPESSVVPETIYNDKMLISKSVSRADTEEACSLGNNLSVEAENHNRASYYPIRTESVVTAFDISRASFHSEEVGDSQAENVVAVARECQMMDECSRVDFKIQSMLVENCGEKTSVSLIGGTWKKLRSCHGQLKHLVTLGERDIYNIMSSAYKMSSVISEADVLLSGCQLVLQDVLDPTCIPPEEFHDSYWFEEQLNMTSMIMEFGLGFFSKTIATLHSNTSSSDHLANSSIETRHTVNPGSKGYPICQNSWNCDLKSRDAASSIQSAIQSLVPSRVYMMNDTAKHEFISSLCQISTSEAGRLSNSTGRLKRRSCRGRVLRHYLDDGTLSPSDIELINQFSRFASTKQS